MKLYTKNHILLSIILTSLCVCVLSFGILFFFTDFYKAQEVQDETIAKSEDSRQLETLEEFDESRWTSILDERYYDEVKLHTQVIKKIRPA